MKRIICLILLFSLSVFSQTPPPPGLPNPPTGPNPPGLPINELEGILFAAGILFGIFVLKKKYKIKLLKKTYF
ncbi:hypothetical protein [Flavobacterium sp. H4147]|uniref:hypothetical protein n=1 Tax=Flavobacterium sp. H4147 TaxID=3034149 RepID=UPI0023EBF2F3|nr:hypothetical protein [Flavobacterium sp. H4147]